MSAATNAARRIIADAVATNPVSIERSDCEVVARRLLELEARACPTYSPVNSMAGPHGIACACEWGPEAYNKQGHFHSCSCIECHEPWCKAEAELQRVIAEWDLCQTERNMLKEEKRIWQMADNFQEHQLRIQAEAKVAKLEEERNELSIECAHRGRLANDNFSGMLEARARIARLESVAEAARYVWQSDPTLAYKPLGDALAALGAQAAPERDAGAK